MFSTDIGKHYQEFKRTKSNSRTDSSRHGIQQWQSLAILCRQRYCCLHSQLWSVQSNTGAFVYNEEQDYYQCDRGVKLPYKKTYQDKKGYYKKQYRSSAKDCGSCPLRTTCIGSRADYKKIENTTDKHLYDQMHQRLQTWYAKSMKKRRQSTVEPVLGTLINFMGIRRIWTRGIKGANKFMLGAAIAYNLKKWLNYKEEKLKIGVLALTKKGKGLCFYFLCLRLSVRGSNR